MTAVVSMEIQYVRPDGTLTYEGLALLQDLQSASSGVADGDKGDITVSGSGSVWTIDAGAIALDDLSDVIITAPATNEVLTYNGTNWVNAAATAGGSPVIAWAI